MWPSTQADTCKRHNKQHELTAFTVCHLLLLPLLCWCCFAECIGNSPAACLIGQLAACRKPLQAARVHCRPAGSISIHTAMCDRHAGTCLCGQAGMGDACEG
eukprot:GHRQ01028775.1.p2 GENE.GHRQ01028775.1~~GHRQ01028775.1.p2  ORF type:complete len:102 (+),score=19.78 GHRQ01028775.1:344-649(+)